MEAGRWVDEARRVPTLKEAISEYRLKVAVRMKGAADYAYRFDEFEELPFAAKPVDTVTPFDLAAWRDEQMPRLAPGTVVRKLALLSGVFTWCVKERGWMTVNPLSLVSKPRVADGRDRTLSEEELKYLTAAAHSSKATWLSAALTVLMHSAMRVAASCSRYSVRMLTQECARPGCTIRRTAAREMCLFVRAPWLRCRNWAWPRRSGAKIR